MDYEVVEGYLYLFKFNEGGGGIFSDPPGRWNFFPEGIDIFNAINCNDKHFKFGTQNASIM